MEKVIFSIFYENNEFVSKLKSNSYKMLISV